MPSFNLWYQHIIALGSGATQFRIAPPSSVAPVCRWGNLQYLADWLDPVGIPVLVDVGVYDFSLRSSSACAVRNSASE